METLLAALIGGFFGSVAGAAITGIVALSLARNERKQSRKAATYVDVLATLMRQQDLIGQTEPGLVIEGRPLPDVTPVSDNELRLLSARVTAYGSQDVKKRLEALAAVGRSFFANVYVFRDLGPMGPGLPPDARQEVARALEGIEGKRTEYADIIKDLGVVVARELDG